MKISKKELTGRINLLNVEIKKHDRMIFKLQREKTPFDDERAELELKLKEAEFCEKCRKFYLKDRKDSIKKLIDNLYKNRANWSKEKGLKEICRELKFALFHLYDNITSKPQFRGLDKYAVINKDINHIRKLIKYIRKKEAIRKVKKKK